MNLQHLRNRFDANETIFLQRELETIDPVNYMNLFAGLLARRYIPLVENVSPLDNAYTYKMFEVVGVARVGSPTGQANNDPVVSVKMVDKSSGIKQIPVTCKWTIREIKQAAKQGIPLDNITIQAAMTAVAREQDTLAAFGLAGTTIVGLLNNPLVQIDTAGTKSGTGAGTAWKRTVPVDPNEIILDLNTLVANTRNALKQASQSPGGNELPAFAKFTILVDSLNYSYIATTPRSSNSDTTILQYVLKNNPWIESIEEWWQCDLANAGGTGGRMVCYPRDSMCLGLVLPVDYESQSPQEQGHEIIVPGNGSCGGTVIRYPVAVRYMDGI